jgi:hypothetical protein
MNHLDDDAELYALGLTERERDAEIEAHIAACEPCRARVVAAEAAAASLSAALPPAPVSAQPAPVSSVAGRRSWWPSLAAAAAVVLSVSAAAEGVIAQSASAQLARTDVALTAIASSHFAHTTMASDPGVIAKALYARDAAWCYVVVSGAPRGARVVLVEPVGGPHRQVKHDAGALEEGAPATLFVRNPGRVSEIDVVAADGHTIAYARPTF